MNPRRLIPLLLAALLPLGIHAQDWAALDAKLEEYCSAMAGEVPDVKKGECDFIISSCTDSLIRDHVAIKLYDWYISSKVMGDEAVAIHLTDNWFSPGKVSMASGLDLMNARIFADFNRQSLLGEKAPPLLLQDPEGNVASPLEGGGRMKVLYFHDTQCSTCKVENILLQVFFAKDRYELDFISVYTGTDPVSWKEYCAGTADMASSRVSVRNFWDPDSESDFQMKYGVLSTPKMFLIDPEGVIVGRGLDAPSLERLLDARRAAYKEVTSDLLRQLWESPDQSSREGARYVADSLVLAHPEIWDTRKDTVEVVSMARFVSEMTSRAEIGSRLPALRVPGELVRSCSSRKVTRRLDRLHRRAYIVFWSEDCSSCRRQLKDMRPEDGVAYFLVNMDEISASDPSLAKELLDAFDLSVLPHIILADKKGKVQGKYLSLDSGELR